MYDSTLNRLLTTKLGLAIRARRIETGLSEAAVAVAAGVDVSELTEIETGDQRATPQQLVALSFALDVRPSWFFADLVGHTGVG